ncbi:MAG TPA: hypothetical protein VFU76_11555 [Terriglobales bacterium]|nr:hypothetical protein [Terriglobales bacterium]
MKRLWLLLVACALGATAQNPSQAQEQGQLPPGAPVRQMTNLVEKAEAPSYTDLNCSGYISKQAPSTANFVAGGAESPVSSQFGQDDTIFFNGSGYEVGQRYSIVRAVKDPNRMEMFPHQHADVLAVGQPYQDIAHARVVSLRGSMAIAVIDFSCTAVTAGDYVVPFQERAQVAYHPKGAFEQWPASVTGLQGRIVMANDFDTIVAAGHKVYLNVGADKGVKPGDYFRVLRSYDPKTMDPIEALSDKQPVPEDTQKNVIRTTPAQYKAYPLQAIGEMVVLHVTPSSSTAMITLSLRSINVGDRVEMEGAPAAAPSTGQR